MANLLTDLSLTSAYTVTGSFAVITGMTTTVTIAGTGSVVLLAMTLNPELVSDECAEYRFTHDGARVGPVVSSFVDATDEGSGRSLFFALTGLSAGSHTFAVEAANRSGTAVIDTNFVRTFQVIEIESGASILVDLETSASNTVPSTYADMTGLSVAATPNAGALLLFIHGSQILGQTGQKASIHRFAIDGTQDGPEMSNVMDNVDETTGCTMVHAKTGVSATSQTFSVQHEVLLGTAVMDTARPRIFQVVQIDTLFALSVDVESVSADSAASGYTDMTDMTGSPDIDSTDSIGLLLANYTIGGAADATSNNQFEIGTTLDGAEVSVWTDAADRPESLSMAFAITGESGVTDVAFQWQIRKASPATNTSLPRTFQFIDFEAAPVGDIAAALDIVLTVAADLDAQGKLDAALNIVLAQAADLTAAGRLDAALPIILAVVADLKGAGELTAVQSIILTIAADLTAIGELRAAALIALTVAADLDAIGEIQAALAIVLNVAADLDAPGTLSAALGIVLTVVADLTAAGELRAAASIILTVVADLTEADRIDLQAALNIVLNVAADLDAEGRLDAALNIVLNQAADLTAAGRLDAALPIIVQVIADLKGAGELTAAQSIILTVAANLTATGRLDATLDIVLAVAADLDAVGQLTANMQIVLAMAADLKAAGELRAALAVVLTVVADLSRNDLAAALLIRVTIVADLQPAVPEAPVVGGSPAVAGPPTVTLTEQQVVQRQLLREDDEAMSVVLTALGLIRK